MDPNQNCFPYFSQYYSRNAEVLGSLVLECRAPTSPPTWNRSIQECGSVLPPQISRTIPNRRFFRPVHQQEGVANFDHLYKIHQLLCLDQNQHSVSKPLTPHSWERGKHVPLPLGTTHRLLYGIPNVRWPCTEFVKTSSCLTHLCIPPRRRKLASPVHLPAAAAVPHRDGPSTLVHDRIHPSGWQSPAA